MKRILCLCLSLWMIISALSAGAIPALAEEDKPEAASPISIEYVTVRKKSVEELSYGTYKTDITGNKYYHYNPDFFMFEMYDKLVVHYSDGSEHSYVHRDDIFFGDIDGRHNVIGSGFIDNEGNILKRGTDWSLSDSQLLDHWLVGTHYVTFEYKGLTCEVPVTITEKGWIQENGKWYYYRNGAPLQYFQTINNKRYYFTGKGVMVTGWFHGKKWYYADPRSGIVATGWKNINNKWYLFRYTDGSMITGWYKNGKGQWFLLSGSGAMVTGWRKVSGTWYYFDANGVMLSNTTRSIGGKAYSFAESGACLNP